MKGSKLAVFLSIAGALALIVAACAPAATPTPTATPTPLPVVATPTPEIATPTPAPGVATPTPAPVVERPQVTPVVGFKMPYEIKYSEFGEYGMPLNLPPPQYGGVFRVGDTQAIPHFDTHRTYTSGVVDYTGTVFDMLVRFSPYLDVEIMPTTYELKHLGPSLAEKWEISQDGKMITFFLRRGVKWHDGKPFTAKDVVYSLNKMLDPSLSIFTADFTMVDRIETADDYTVKVYLKYAGARHFLLVLGMGQAAIQPEHRKDVSYRTPEFMVGTGAFKFKTYTPGIEFVVEKNPDYYFKGRPYFDSVKWYFLGTEDAAAQAFAAAQVDYRRNAGIEAVVSVTSRVAPEIVTRYHNKLMAHSNYWVSFIKENPLQDGRVRKAMTMVMDRVAVCLAAYGSQWEKLCNPKPGYFDPPPAGRGLPWSEYEKAWGLDKPMEARIAAAKKLLAEAGYPNGFKTSTLTSATPSAAVLAAIDQWKRTLNVDMSPRIVPAAAVLELLGRGDFDTHTRGSVNFAGAMEQYVSGNYIKGGLSNWGRYEHPVVEELYQRLIRETNEEEALRIFQRIERLLIDDVPVIPNYVWNHSLGYWPYVTPKMFEHPVWHSQWSGFYTVVWFDRNHPTWAKRAK